MPTTALHPPKMDIYKDVSLSICTDSVEKQWGKKSLTSHILKPQSCLLLELMCFADVVLAMLMHK